MTYRCSSCITLGVLSRLSQAAKRQGVLRGQEYQNLSVGVQLKTHNLCLLRITLLMLVRKFADQLFAHQSLRFPKPGHLSYLFVVQTARESERISANHLRSTTSSKIITCCFKWSISSGVSSRSGGFAFTAARRASICSCIVCSIAELLESISRPAAESRDRVANASSKQIGVCRPLNKECTFRGRRLDRRRGWFGSFFVRTVKIVALCILVCTINIVR